jgi:2-(1,2-epoxy-1,2-dihydrophenyl)acetyl-CoA isomerase
MRDGGVEVIYFNQPAKRNAISAAMMEGLSELLRAADADDQVRVVVLRGVGAVFSSGGDLSQGGPAGPEAARKTYRKYAAAVRTLRQIAKPVICMVQGYAVGGAFSLCLAADLLVCSDSAVFIPAFCQIGIIPEMGMMKYLQDLVGAHRAKELLFCGGRIAPAYLERLGVVNHVYPDGECEAATYALAQALAEQPDASIQITKNLMNALADTNLAASLDAEATASPFCTTTAAFAATQERFNK